LLLACREEEFVSTQESESGVPKVWTDLPTFAEPTPYGLGRALVGEVGRRLKVRRDPRAVPRKGTGLEDRLDSFVLVSVEDVSRRLPLPQGGKGGLPQEVPGGKEREWSDRYHTVLPPPLGNHRAPHNGHVTSTEAFRDSLETVTEHLCVDDGFTPVVDLDPFWILP
jgi:hypothetical protein